MLGTRMSIEQFLTFIGRPSARMGLWKFECDKNPYLSIWMVVNTPTIDTGNKRFSVYAGNGNVSWA
jgi:hypothetical protein